LGQKNTVRLKRVRLISAENLHWGRLIFYRAYTLEDKNQAPASIS